MSIFPHKCKKHTRRCDGLELFDKLCYLDNFNLRPRNLLQRVEMLIIRYYIFCIRSHSAVDELLSSESAGSNSKCTYVFCNVVVDKFTIASTTLFAISGVDFCAIISSYSSKISVFTHKLILPSKTSVQILWYGLFVGSA